VLWELKEAAKWEDMGIMGSQSDHSPLAVGQTGSCQRGIQTTPGSAELCATIIGKKIHGDEQLCRRCKDRKVLPIVVVAFSFSSYIRSHVAK
jgi:hypothetical protein